MSIAIDDGPLDTMPNMSPSWTSSFEIFLNSSRTRPVLLELQMQIVDEEQEDPAGRRRSAAAPAAG